MVVDLRWRTCNAKGCSKTLTLMKTRRGGIGWFLLPFLFSSASWPSTCCNERLSSSSRGDKKDEKASQCLHSIYRRFSPLPLENLRYISKSADDASNISRCTYISNIHYFYLYYAPSCTIGLHCYDASSYYFKCYFFKPKDSV